MRGLQTKGRNKLHITKVPVAIKKHICKHRHEYGYGKIQITGLIAQETRFYTKTPNDLQNVWLQDLKKQTVFMVLVILFPFGAVCKYLSLHSPPSCFFHLEGTTVLQQVGFTSWKELSKSFSNCFQQSFSFSLNMFCPIPVCQMN